MTGVDISIGLTDLTLNAVRAESIRAHIKHHRPDEGSGSLFDHGLTLVSRLAALMEEIGEVAEELVPATNFDGHLDELVNVLVSAGQHARRLTYDGGNDGDTGGLDGSGVRDLPPTIDKTRLVKELIQVANVSLSWAQYLESPASRRHG